jgi:colicin import membrane protein
MHLILLAILVFSLDWTPKISRPAGQKVPIEATLVDQRQLEAVEEQKRAEEHRIEEARRQAEEAERRKQAEAEAKRKAEVAAKQKAEADAKRKAEAEAKLKAAAEAKRKAEAEAKRKAAAEAKRKAAAEAKRKAEAEAKRKAEAEAKRKAEAEAKRKAAAEAKRKAEEARKRAEADLQAQLAAEQAAAEQARARGIVNEYVGYIADKVRRNWLRPPGSPQGLSCEVQVSLIPGGDVSRVRITRSSGDPIFDRSVETAVYKAAPLPLPPDASLFNYFREIRFVFKPTS